LIAAAKLLWPLPDKGLKKRLHRIAAPTLLVWGAHDRMTGPAYASAFGARVAGAAMRTVRAGHMMPHEAPAETADVVRAFVANGAA
jgi:pimeloyl-ACP methyl ester carboxylesterase